MSAHLPWHGRWLRQARLGSLLLVLAASLGGVVLVGLGEAFRGYGRLQFERLAAQGAIIQRPVELLLRVGVALEQFTGFTNLARVLREADPTLEEIRIVDAQGRLLFSEPPSGQSLDGDGGPASRSALALPGRHFEVLEDARSFRVLLPLADRFEAVGRLELVMSREAVSQRVLQRFQPVFTFLGLCLLLQVVLVLATQPLWMRRARLWLGLSFGISWVGMALVTFLALADLYSDGLQQGTSSLAHSLARRLNEAARLGLTLSNLRGLDTLLQDYQRSNSDLGSLALTADEQVLIRTDAHPGRPSREPAEARFDYALDLELTEGPWNTPVRLEVSAATGALHVRLWRSCRNLLLVLIASGLLGLLLLNALAPLPRPGPRQQAFERVAVARLRPLAFFGCFLEALHLAFLSGYVEALAARQGHPSGASALLVVAACGAHVLALLSTERYTRGVRLERLLGAGLLVSSAPVFAMALTGDLRLLLLLHCVSGLGLGALAGGLQAYLLAALRPEHPPHGASLLTPARHGGLFSGTAIGALLAAHVGPREVFLFGGLCGLAALGYAWLFLPRLAARDVLVTPQPRRAPRASRLHAGPRPWRPREHHPATLLVGLPTLLVRGGVISFALPLLLVHRGHDVDRIGQLLALHPLGVLLSHSLLTRLFPGAGQTRRLLQAGMLGTGLGLLALGFVDALPAPGASGTPEALCAVAVAWVGLSHGAIFWPLERHLSSLQEGVSEKRASLFLNQCVGVLGQGLGPLLVSALLRVHPDSFQALGWLGVMTLILGAWFSWTTRRQPGHEVHHA